MTSHLAARPVRLVILVTLLVPITYGACSAPPTGDENGDGEAPPVAAEPLNPDSIRVEFVNLSTAAVDTQFYAADEPLGPLPDALIIADNLVRPGIGVAGTGILAPFAEDQIELPCSDELVVGTAGGEFLDVDLGASLGTGPVRFMQAGFQFDCGATLVFEYGETDSGYTVILFQDK